MQRLWEMIHKGQIASADIEAELGDIDKHHSGSKIEEAHVLDLLDALTHTRAREQEQRRASKALLTVIK